MEVFFNKIIFQGYRYLKCFGILPTFYLQPLHNILFAFRKNIVTALVYSERLQNVIM